MNIDQIHEMAIRINENWNDLKGIKRQFVNESDFWRMIDSAYLLARVSEC